MSSRIINIDQQFPVRPPDITGLAGYQKSLTSSGTNSLPAGPEYNEYDLFVHEEFKPIVTIDGSTVSLDSFLQMDFDFSHIDPWTPSDDTALVSKLIDSIKGHKFNAAVSLGEARESLTMIGDTTRTLARAFRDVKKGRFASAARRLGLEKPPAHLKAYNSAKALKGNWLAYQYGWVPLLGDTVNAAEAMAKHFGNVTLKTSHRARRKKKTGLMISEGAAGVYYTQQNFVQKQLIVKFSDDHPLSLGSELGLDDPFSVAWELLPYSFVVDWFAPIGDYLANAAAIRSLKPGVIIYTTKTTQEIKCSSGSRVSFDQPGYANRIVLSRRILSSIPNPLPIPNVQQLKEAFSFRHALSGLALLGNAIR